MFAEGSGAVAAGDHTARRSVPPRPSTRLSSADDDGTPHGYGDACVANGSGLQRDWFVPRGIGALFVEAEIEEMTKALTAGEKVAIPNFGSFVTRFKGPSMVPIRRPGS